MAPAGSICEDGVDLIGHCFEQVLQELPSCRPVCLVDELGHGKLARSVDADEQVELSFSSLHLGDVDMEKADRVALELRPLRLVAPRQASVRCHAVASTDAALSVSGVE